MTDLQRGRAIRLLKLTALADALRRSMRALALLLFAVQASAAPLRITVENDGWGKAPPDNLRAVLVSAGGELWKYCPRTELDEILVQHRDDHPQANWQRGADGRIVIGLASRDTFWAQFAFQFAHEFCHALATHSNDWRQTWREDGKPNHWLEESLCETASLFALRAMGRSWETAPPYPNWKSFAPALTDYAQERLDDPKHALPSGMTFPAWFRAEEPELRKQPTQREKNTLIAKQLLPLFEADPRGWEAMTYFNLGPHDRTMPLAQFLREWRDRCPPDLCPLIEKLAATFGATLGS